MGIWSRLWNAVRNKDVGPVGSELFGVLDGWGRSTSGIPVNTFSAMQHVAVMACVMILAEDIAKLPVGLFRRLPNGGKEPVQDHYLSRLFMEPNDWQTRVEYMQEIMGHLLLRSNAYSVILRDDRGKPTELVPIHPNRVTLFEAPGGEYFFAVSRQGLHEMAKLRGRPILEPQEDIFHLRWMSTTHSLLGTSRIGMMAESIGLSIAQLQHMGKVMSQGARPSGVLSSDKIIPEEVGKRIKTAWQQAYGASGSEAGGTAILELGLNWQQLSMSLADAQFLEVWKFMLEDIARGFRIPRHKLGLPVEGAATGLVQYEQAYVNDCIATWCDLLVPRLEKLGREPGEPGINVNGREFFVEFDYEHLLKPDIKTRLEAKRSGVTAMIYTPDEARRAEGLPDLPDGLGAKMYRPANLVPIDTPVPVPGAGGVGSDTTGKPAPGGAGDESGAAPAGDSPASNE
jgi:HK97 family phage portal protein